MPAKHPDRFDENDGALLRKEDGNYLLTDMGVMAKSRRKFFNEQFFKWVH